MAFFPLCTRFWSAAQQTASKAVSSLATPICPTSFPRGCELESMRETWKIWSAGCLWRHFSFYFSPHVSAPLNTVPEEEQPFKQGCQRQSSFSCCLLLLCLGRAETHLGKEGLAFCRFISLHMPFHCFSFFMSGESEWLDGDEKNPSQGPFLSPSLPGWGWASWPRQSAQRMLGYFQGFNLSNIPGFMENLGEGSW